MSKNKKKKNLYKVFTSDLSVISVFNIYMSTAPLTLKGVMLTL